MSGPEIESTETSTFSALPPGWRNVYMDESGRWEVPCPGVVITTVRWDDDTIGRNAHYAVMDGPNCELIEAWLKDGYVTTLAPGQTFDEWLTPIRREVGGAADFEAAVQRERDNLRVSAEARRRFEAEQAQRKTEGRASLRRRAARS